MAKKIHGWIVDVDHLADDDVGRVGTFGPRGISDEARDRLILLREEEPSLLRGRCLVRRWRCLDDDGEVCYEGRYVGPRGDEREFSPLDDFARPDAGATTIEYLDANGTWEAL